MNDARLRRRRLMLGKFLQFFLPVLFAAVAVGAAAAAMMVRRNIDELHKENENQLYQVRDSVEMLFRNVDSIAVSICSDIRTLDNMAAMLDNEMAASMEGRTEIRRFFRYIASLANANPYVHSVYVYVENGSDGFITTLEEQRMLLGSFFDTGWHDSYLTSKGRREQWAERRYIQRYSFEQTTEIVSLYRTIYPLGMVTKGVVVQNVARSAISGFIDPLKLFEGQQFFVLNADGNELYRYREQGPALDDYNTRDFFVVRLGGGQYGWSYASVVPKSAVYASVSSLFGTLVYVLFLGLLISAFLSVIFSQLRYKRVQGVIRIVESRGRYQPPPRRTLFKYADEYDYIIENVVLEYVEKTELARALSQKQHELEMMETVALQSQINPHFLFNTLEMIKWEGVGLTGRPNQVSSMLEQLADVVRYAFSAPLETIRLGDEIAVTKSYVAILRQRYVDKFTVEWRIAPEVEDIRLIKLLLQPLIENSVYHGIKEKILPGRVRVTAVLRGTVLSMTVLDNGVGMSRARLTEVREMLEDNDAPDGRHIGLRNIRRRLLHMYGKRASFIVQSIAGRGSRVVIRIERPGDSGQEPTGETPN